MVEYEELPRLPLVVAQGGVGGGKHRHIVVQIVLVQTICGLQHLSKLREGLELPGEIGIVLVQTICGLQHLSKL